MNWDMRPTPHASFFNGRKGRLHALDNRRRTDAPGKASIQAANHRPSNKLIDEEGNTTAYRYDATGKRVAMITPNQSGKEEPAETSYHYDLMDHLVKTVDECGSVYAYKVDSEGNILKSIHPNTYDEAKKDGEGICYEYDTDGNRIKVIHPTVVSRGLNTMPVVISLRLSSPKSMTLVRMMVRDIPMSMMRPTV